jgi:VWFA-related protein
MRAPFAILVLFPCLLGAQESPVFRAETTLIQVRFHVTEKDRYVTDLKPEDVILLEDGVPRPFTAFDNAITGLRNTPVELTLLFDTSASVADAGLLEPLAFKETLFDALGNVRVAVYGFGRDMTEFTAPTRDYAQLTAAFAAVRDRHLNGQRIELRLPPKRKPPIGGGNTWLYEAVIAGIRAAGATPGDASRMILVFSDGFGDTSSAPQDAAEVDREFGIPIYPVILGHRDLVARLQLAQQRLGTEEPTSAETLLLHSQEARIQDFARLAELTGGRSFDPPEMNLLVLRQMLGNMVALVRTEYAVGFVPARAEAPRKHNLEIRLRDKDLGKVRGGTRTVVH